MGLPALDDFKQFDAPMPLRELVIVDPASPCVGMSVAAVLAEANLALGSCAAQLPAGALSDCAAMINESFVDGEAAGEALCSDRLAPPESRPRTPTPTPCEPDKCELCVGDSELPAGCDQAGCEEGDVACDNGICPDGLYCATGCCLPSPG